MSCKITFSCAHRTAAHKESRARVARLFPYHRRGPELVTGDPNESRPGDSRPPPTLALPLIWLISGNGTDAARLLRRLTGVGEAGESGAGGFLAAAASKASTAASSAGVVEGSLSLRSVLAFRKEYSPLTWGTTRRTSIGIRIHSLIWMHDCGTRVHGV